MNTGAIEYDYAVIEFACDLNPGDTTGWMSFGWSDPSNGGYEYILSSTTQFDAYDAHDPNPAGYLSTTGPGYSYPSLISRSYGAYTASVDPFNGNLEVWIDATAGSSGGGLQQTLFSDVGDPTYYYTGTMHGKDSERVQIQPGRQSIVSLQT